MSQDRDLSGRGPEPGGRRRRNDRSREEWASIEPSFVADYGELTHRRSRPPRRRRRGRLLGFAFVAMLAFLIGLGTGYARGYFSSGQLGPEVRVTIPSGSSLSTIAARLEAKRIVKHARAFVIKAQSDGHATDFKPGTYTLHENEPYDSLVAALVRGVKAPTIKVTIPEGYTLMQSAEIASGKVRSISRTRYVTIARDDPPPFKLQGYKAGTTLEGMLFPATYDVAPGTSAGTFIDRQLAAFDEQFAEVDMTRATKASLTAYDIVIIASMIDREAMVAAERPLVAAVIWNRLKQGMLLQIDATIQYALGKTKAVLTYDDLKIESPYNTYLHAGLPPTPISNPGLAAMQAAGDPSSVDYLYYVARNDGTGRHYFSSSYEQFLVDKAKAAATGQ